MSKIHGPLEPASEKVHAEKYRSKGESFRDAMTRIASALSDNEEHFRSFRDILLNMRFLPGGRIQSAIGNTKSVTPYNCFVSGIIKDSLTKGSGSILDRLKEAADTMRFGGGIGYDFSTIRPRGDLIKRLQSQASGPISFMDVFDSSGRAIASSGHRRGAQMGVLRVDHPDIEEFVRAKQSVNRLTSFNVSIAITEEFMVAVTGGKPFSLRWNDQVYRQVDARVLWDTIMRSTYDWSEPGVLFIDKINAENNLYYCEKIFATNPCGEQPLPPFGACLLGSFNLVKYLSRDSDDPLWDFDYAQFFADIPYVVRAMDNVVDRAVYPLDEQEQEAVRKRRMGIGVTGLANCVEAMGHLYASEVFISIMRAIMVGLKNEVYRASARLAREKGAFPLYNREAYLDSKFVRRLAPDVRDEIAASGIRNSHLLSVAPTGTISFTADNISSGIEPVYAYKSERVVMEFNGPRQYKLEDYGKKYLGVEGKTAKNCSVEDHLRVLKTASQYVDSAVSKTINIPENYPWEEFKDVYLKAWASNCKGCTTHRTNNFRGSVVTETEDRGDIMGACEVINGTRSCE